MPVVQNCMCFLRTFVFLLKSLTSQMIDSRISVLEIVRWSRDCKFIKTKVFAGDSSVFTKLWQKGGRFPTVIHSASSPNCLLWRLLVDFQATNSSVVHMASCWAVSPGCQVALSSQGFKALGFLSACLVESWEPPPNLHFQLQVLSCSADKAMGYDLDLPFQV